MYGEVILIHYDSVINITCLAHDSRRRVGKAQRAHPTSYLTRKYKMPNIADTLNEFVEALEKNIPIECDNKGQWTHERSCHKITRLLTLNYYDRNQLVTIAKTF